MSESVVAQLDDLLQRLEVLRALERDAEIERLRARVAELEYAYSKCLAAVGGVQQDGDPS